MISRALQTRLTLKFLVDKIIRHHQTGILVCQPNLLQMGLFRAEPNLSIRDIRALKFQIIRQTSPCLLIIALIH